MCKNEKKNVMSTHTYTYTHTDTHTPKKHKNIHTHRCLHKCFLLLFSFFEFLQTSKLASDPYNSEILEEIEEDVKIIQCLETIDRSPILIIF